MTLLNILKILFAGGILATVYRGYLVLIQEHYQSKEDALDKKTKQDLGKVDEDAKRVQSTQNDFDNLVNKFNDKHNKS